MTTKKNSTRRLPLRKETLRTLSDVALSEIIGGAVSVSYTSDDHPPPKGLNHAVRVRRVQGRR